MGIKTIWSELNSLPSNVKTNLCLVPLWSIPFNMVNSYASLYMLNKGITATNVGLINSTGFILKTIIAIFAGYIINRFGRRRTLGILDAFGWALPMLIYYFATDYWQFMVASLINCVTVINGIVNQCFLVEDVEQNKRIHAFNAFYIVISASGLFVPITGIIIGKMTLVPAIKLLYLFAFFSMLAGAFFKFFLLKETSVGIEMMNRKIPLGNPIKNLLVPLRYILGNHRLVFLFSMNILFNFTMTIVNLYYFPYLTKSLHYSESIVSLFPFATTLISLCVYFFIVPTIRNMVKSIKLSVALYTSGAFLLILAYFTSGKIAMLCVICWAIAGSIMNPVLNTMIANNLKDEMRTEVIGFFNIFSMLCMFPAGYFGGLLYEIAPIYPICFAFATYFICMMFFAFQKNMKNANQKE